MDTVSKFSLGSDVRYAIAEAKTEFSTGSLKKHQGIELSQMITFARGAQLYEKQVGEDREGDAGKRRIVFYVESGQLKRVFFSSVHYKHGSWKEVYDY